MFTQIWFLPFHFKQPVLGDEENKSPVSLDQGLTAALGALQDDCAITPPHSIVQHSCLSLSKVTTVQILPRLVGNYSQQPPE